MRAEARLIRHHAPVTERDEPVGVRGERGIVGDEDERAAERAVEAQDQLDDLLAGGGVEIAGGLVGEEHRRPARHRARDGHALLLATRELDRIVLRAIGEPYLVQERAGPGERVRLARQLQRHRDVLQRGEGGNEVKGLEDVPDGVEAEAGGGGPIEPGDEAEQGGLAATRRPRDGHELARGDREGHVREHVDGSVAAGEAHADARDLNNDCVSYYTGDTEEAGTRTCWAHTISGRFCSPACSCGSRPAPTTCTSSRGASRRAGA